GGRGGGAVGRVEVVRHYLERAVGSEAIDAVGRLLLARDGLLPPPGWPGAAPDPRLDAVGWVGEVDRAVGLDHDVVGAVQSLALETLGEHGARTVVRDARDATAVVLGGDHATLSIEGEAVGVPPRVRGQLRPLGQAAPARDALVRDIAEEQGAGAPHRPLREGEPACHAFDGRIGGDEIVQRAVTHFQNGHGISLPWATSWCEASTAASLPRACAGRPAGPGSRRRTQLSTLERQTSRSTAICRRRSHSLTRLGAASRLPSPSAPRPRSRQTNEQIRYPKRGST